MKSSDRYYISGQIAFFTGLTTEKWSFAVLGGGLMILSWLLDYAELKYEEKNES